MAFAMHTTKFVLQYVQLIIWMKREREHKWPKVFISKVYYCSTIHSWWKYPMMQNLECSARQLDGLLCILMLQHRPKL